ncbi:hypothetical protein SAMN05216416_0650 [Streptococcus equinus]|nr:hypothetical protein SAMN05216416_0650 [Streptococcus equinus]
MKKECKVTVTLLCSLFLLGACSRTERAKPASSSHIKVTRTSKSKAEKKVMKPNVSTNQEVVASSPSVTDMTVAGNEAQDDETKVVSPSQDQANQPSESDIDFECLAYGDFSSLAGTWSNDLGESVTLAQDGQASLSRTQSPYQVKTNIVKGNVCFGTIYDPNSLTESAAFIVVPKGIGDPFLGEVRTSDCLIIGQCASDSEHPYFKH